MRIPSSRILAICFVTLGLDLLETRDGDDLFILTTHEQIEQLRDEGWRIRVDDEMTT